MKNTVQQTASNASTTEIKNISPSITSRLASNVNEWMNNSSLVENLSIYDNEICASGVLIELMDQEIALWL